MATTPVDPNAIRILLARADRLEEEAVGLRRLAKDLAFQQAHVEDGGFAFHPDSIKTLNRLAKL